MTNRCFSLKKKKVTSTLKISRRQKQPPEMFYEKSCSSKFLNIHRETPVLESLFKKAAGLKETLLKRDSNTGVFPGILLSFQERLFWRTSANGCFWKEPKFIWWIHLGLLLRKQAIHKIAGKGRGASIFLSTTSFHSPTYIYLQFYKWGDLVFLIACNYRTLLFNEIYQPMEISIWLDINCFYSFVLS